MPYPAVDAPHTGSPPITRHRLAAVVFAVGLHLLILTLFLTGHRDTKVDAGVGLGATNVSLAGLSRSVSQRSQAATPPKAAVPPVPPTPPQPVDQIKPRSVLAIVSEILAIPLPEQSVTPTPLVSTPSPAMVEAVAQVSGASGTACDITGAIQTALRLDPVVHNSLQLIPSKERTAANAVVVWNGQWLGSGGIGPDPAFDSLRGAIRQIVSAAPVECRDRQLVGPQFMLIPNGETTVTLVFGNASWRWSDLSVDATASSSVRF